MRCSSGTVPNRNTMTAYRRPDVMFHATRWRSAFSSVFLNWFFGCWQPQINSVFQFTSNSLANLLNYRPPPTGYLRMTCTNHVHLDNTFHHTNLGVTELCWCLSADKLCWNKPSVGLLPHFTVSLTTVIMAIVKLHGWPQLNAFGWLVCTIVAKPHSLHTLVCTITVTMALTQKHVYYNI
jgi:uncharacterized membrane protein